MHGQGPNYVHNIYESYITPHNLHVHISYIPIYLMYFRIYAFLGFGNVEKN